MIKEYENEMEKMPEKMSITVTQAKQVIPMQDMLVASALKGEIADLKAENDILQEQIKKMESENEEFKVFRNTQTYKLHFTKIRLNS